MSVMTSQCMFSCEFRLDGGVLIRRRSLCVDVDVDAIDCRNRFTPSMVLVRVTVAAVRCDEMRVDRRR